MQIFFLESACYSLMAYIVRVLQMAIIPFKLHFIVLDNEI